MRHADSARALSARRALKPTPGQAEALEATAQLFAERCNRTLRAAKGRGELHRFRLRRPVRGDVLVPEDLTGSRERTARRGREERRLRNPWPRACFLLEHKAGLKEVRAVTVDPRRTGRERPRCGYAARENRGGQALFRRGACGLRRDADWAASVNIARGALAQGVGSEGLGHGQLAMMPGDRLTHLRLLAS